MSDDATLGHALLARARNAIADRLSWAGTVALLGIVLA